MMSFDMSHENDLTDISNDYSLVPRKSVFFQKLIIIFVIDKLEMPVIQRHHLKIKTRTNCDLLIFVLRFFFFFYTKTISTFNMRWKVN